tara:strand:- start:9975 stop:10745 length:771 start_codon:yes stop_codon:yes gene_type:complete
MSEARRARDLGRGCRNPTRKPPIADRAVISVIANLEMVVADPRGHAEPLSFRAYIRPDPTSMAELGPARERVAPTPRVPVRIYIASLVYNPVREDGSPGHVSGRGGGVMDMSRPRIQQVGGEDHLLALVGVGRRPHIKSDAPQCLPPRPGPYSGVEPYVKTAARRVPKARLRPGPRFAIIILGPGGVGRFVGREHLALVADLGGHADGAVRGVMMKIPTPRWFCITSAGAKCGDAGEFFCSKKAHSRWLLPGVENF